MIYVVKLFKAHTFFSYLDFIIQKLNYNADSEMVRVVKLFIYLLVLVQITACIFIKLAVDADDPGNWVTSKGYQKDDYIDIYCSAVYFFVVTTTTTGYGDFGGSLHQEILYVTICIIF